MDEWRMDGQKEEGMEGEKERRERRDKMKYVFICTSIVAKSGIYFSLCFFEPKASIIQVTILKFNERDRFTSKDKNNCWS